MNELISIVIPVYNHDLQLFDSLKSLKAQTYKNIEIIVVDNGSNDHWEEMVEKSKTELHLPIKACTEPKKGANWARNRGLRELSPESAYVIFWDADTIAKPQMLSKMKTALDNHPEAGYAYSQFYFGWKKMKSQSFNAEELKKNNYIDTTSLIRRRDFLNFDPQIQRFQDWDLWLTLLENKKTGIFIPEILYRKTVGRRRGISHWLPSFFFHLPFKTKAVEEYEKDKKIILDKHHLSRN